MAKQFVYFKHKFVSKNTDEKCHNGATFFCWTINVI